MNIKSVTLRPNGSEWVDIALQDGTFAIATLSNQFVDQWLVAGGELTPAPPPVIGNIQDLAEAKTVAVDYVRSEAYSKLQPTDWAVVREMESGVSAPAEITTYRTAVRAAANEKVTTIESKTKLSTLATYLRSDEFAAWPDAPSA